MGFVYPKNDIENLESNDVLARIIFREENDVVYNTNKIRKYLFDKSYSQELDICVKSLKMAVKKGRQELLLNILRSFSDVYKFAALDIKYFDEYKSNLKVDVFKAFSFKGDVRLLSKNLSGMLNLFDSIEKLSATNAAIAINSAIILGEYKKIEAILLDEKLGHAQILQIEKRYFDNFSKKLLSELKNIPLYDYSKRSIYNKFEDLENF